MKGAARSAAPLQAVEFPTALFLRDGAASRPGTGTDDNCPRSESGGDRLASGYLPDC
jgi:hypothetical protein